jgi:hypothetical protein
VFGVSGPDAWLHLTLRWLVVACLGNTAAIILLGVTLWLKH